MVIRDSLPISISAFPFLVSDVHLQGHISSPILCLELQPSNMNSRKQGVGKG